MSIGITEEKSAIT